MKLYVPENNFHATFETTIKMAFASATSQNLCLYHHIFCSRCFTLTATMNLAKKLKFKFNNEVCNINNTKAGSKHHHMFYSE